MVLYVDVSTVAHLSYAASSLNVTENLFTIDNDHDHDNDNLKYDVDYDCVPPVAQGKKRPETAGNDLDDSESDFFIQSTYIS